MPLILHSIQNITSDTDLIAALLPAETKEKQESPTTIVSQWKVDSASTTDLMLEFHRNLTQKKLPPAKALQQAELKLLRTGQFSHPFYWSAFVVIGNGFSAN